MELKASLALFLLYCLYESVLDGWSATMSTLPTEQIWTYLRHPEMKASRKKRALISTGGLLANELRSKWSALRSWSEQLTVVLVEEAQQYGAVMRLSLLQD